MHRLLLVSLFFIVTLCACSQPQSDDNKSSSTAPLASAFQEARAFQDLAYLCEEIGPRRIGTKGAQLTRDWLKAQLEPHGWEVTTDSFEATPPIGARRKKVAQGANVFAKRKGTLPGEIWLAGHYDTYDLPGFVGANDSGSSTAVLVELARQLGGAGPREGHTLVLAFFDGEERFPPNLWDDFTNSTFGSRHAVEMLKKTGGIRDIKAFVLLDMVGDIDLNLYLESTSAKWLVALMERTAHKLGDPRLFVGRREIKDDHIHFRRAKVPCINLIDFQYGPGHRWWHTRDDDMTHVSAESLGRVGRLILSALPELERLAKSRNR
ncbi:MAG: Zn-dependent exopeptidase M28 [Planctomycetes bacterium]|jgi:hypothetical protein|nr:Zn-dependent exopeptidase M28 [Planctomycetota bacterium]MBT4028593.1 Zn-dependent exopeptidase M28 [Planctomycetota bacterium]MBT4559485.1 Zn-dependent exopeptidase M28 [Planctomycetota bacterium]MBT5101477.1 Zn-dependent exopeptidase M28 [Planctomycetota bacterium]MBT7012980.1 Zn-dependent exopeptidase M28 [Planctomycetota bacterium]